MSTITVQIKGLKQFQSRLVRAPVIVGKHVSLAINRASASILQKTLPITPVKTGRLVGSFALDSVRAKPTNLRGAVRSRVPYAASVHDLHPAGTQYRNPSKNKNAVAGFLKVGVERAQQLIDKHFTDALNNIVKEMGD